ncbi:hypothetical protein Tco_0045691 [Tanacetum coccineum]
MASGGSDRDAEYALSKLLQIGTVAEYQNEFEMLINKVKGISESLLTSFYISGLKLTLQIEMFRAYPTTLGEAFSLARIIEARFEAIAKKEKEQIIEKKADTILSLQSEFASPKIKGSLEAYEDIVLNDKEFVIKVLEGRDISGESLVVCLKWVYRKKSRGAAEDGRMVLCYVRRKKKTMEAAIQRRLWDPRIKSTFQDNTLRERWF